MSTTTGAPNIAHAKAWLEQSATALKHHANYDSLTDDEIRDHAATVADVAKRAPLPVANGAIVVMDASAIAAYHEAVQMIAHAQRWSEGTDLSWEVISGDDGHAGVKIVNRRREQVAQMELSLYRSLAHLSTVAQDYDGPCHVHRDGEGAFFWRHTQSGYHGGIVYHANHENGERLPVGTWSIHT